MIFIENKKKAKTSLVKLYPKADIIDVTSKGVEPFVRLSPFYPHGDIPVPFSEKVFAYTVEGIWQGLKVFEQADIDTSKFEIRSMKGIKRTERKFGKTLGHRKGVTGFELLDYLSARKKIYLPSYAWLLQNKAKKEVDKLIQIALKKDLVLLDYETNLEIDNVMKPLSHAALIKKFIEKKHPELVIKRFAMPEQSESSEKKAEALKKTRDKKSKKKTDEVKTNDSQLTLGF